QRGAGEDVEGPVEFFAVRVVCDGLGRTDREALDGAPERLQGPDLAADERVRHRRVLVHEVRDGLHEATPSARGPGASLYSMIRPRRPRARSTAKRRTPWACANFASTMKRPYSSASRAEPARARHCHAVRSAWIG